MADKRTLRDMSADEIAQLKPEKFKELSDKHNDDLEIRENQRNRRDERRLQQVKDDFVDSLLDGLLKDKADKNNSPRDRFKNIGKIALDVLTLKPWRDDFRAMEQAKKWELEGKEREAKRELDYPAPNTQNQPTNKPLREMNPDEVAQLSPEKFSELAHHHNDQLELRENAAERAIADPNDPANYPKQQQTSLPNSKAEFEEILPGLLAPKPLSALDQRMAKTIEAAKAERSEGRMAFQAAYDSVTEGAEKALEEHRQITQDGVARGFLKRNEQDYLAETSPDGDHRVRPGQKLATDQLKGMEDKERKALIGKVGEAVMWAALDYGAVHSKEDDEWLEPESGISNRPAEKLLTRDLRLTNEAKRKTRNKGRGGPSL